MSKVVLSNGYEFSLVANGTSTGTDSVSCTFIPDDYTLEQLETMWTGNETIKVVLDEGSDAGETIANYTGYVYVKTISKNNQYPKEGSIEGEEEYISVVSVTCTTADLNQRVTDLESSVDDLVSAIIPAV
jgi:hypothetical protein